MEDGTKINGLGTAIEELIVEENLQGIKMEKYAWPDEFIKHGTVEELEENVQRGRFFLDKMSNWDRF